MSTPRGWDDFWAQATRNARSRFWTPDRIEQAAAMRRYRRLWAHLNLHRQHQLECMVCRMRGLGERESVILGVVLEAVSHASAGITDAHLCAALGWKIRGVARPERGL